MKLVLILSVLFLLSSCATTIHDHAKSGNLQGVKDEFAKIGVKGLNQDDSFGQSPIMTAARFGRLEVIKFLIDNGADVNSPGGYKQHNALSSTAMGGGDKRTLIFLLENGADPYAEIRKGVNAITVAEGAGQLELVKLMKNYKVQRKKQVTAQKLEMKTKQEVADWNTAKKANSYSQYDIFLQRYPHSKYRNEGIKAMALIVNRDKRGTKAEAFLQKYPKGKKYLKPGAWLMGLGPEKLKVRDLVANVKQGINENILAAKVKNVNIAYKDFEISEIMYLKKRGLSDTLIQAMIEVTGRLKHEEKRALENKKLLSEIQKLIDQSQSSISKTPSKEKRGGGLVETTSECVKLKAALSACNRAPSFLAMACKSTARGQFNCSM